MSPNVSIIVCTRNRHERITATIESIFANSYPQFELIVIDQSTSESTQKAVEPFRKDARLRYIKSDSQGLSKARNIGISHSKGSIVAFTDDDCRVSDKWLSRIAAEFENHPTVTAVFGRIMPGDLSNCLAHAPHLDLEEAERLQQVLPIAKKEQTSSQLYQEDRYDLSFGHGANMCFRMSTFAKYGLFDEMLGAGAVLGAWEDRDMGYRILSGGGQILYSPDLIVAHDHWREWSEVKASFKNYAIGTGTAVNKYMRSGDWGSYRLFLCWLTQLGIRQICSGIFKWQSWHKTYIGFSQIIFPWLGLVKGFSYPVDKKQKIFATKTTLSPSIPQRFPPT